MKRIFFGFVWMFMSCMTHSAEKNGNRFPGYMVEGKNKPQILQTYPEITSELQSVEDELHSSFNCIQELQIHVFSLYEDVKNAYANVSHASPHVIQNFMNNPETECYNQNSNLPIYIKQIAFELVRARAGLHRDPYSQEWQHIVADNEKKLFNYMHSGGAYFLADHIAHQKVFWALSGKRRTMYYALQNMVHDYHQLQKKHEVLLQKKGDREKVLDGSWRTIAHKLDCYEKSKATSLIQCAVKKLLYNARLHKQIAVAADSFVDNSLQEIIDELVNEQIASMKLEEHNRIKLIADQVDRKAYEKELTKITYHVVDDVVATALAELKDEHYLDKKVREQSKTQLKKNRKKEAENKKKIAQLEEERVLAESIAQSSVQAAMLERINYETRLKHSGSIDEMNLKIAMLAYDFTHLTLFDAYKNIIDEDGIADFMILFMKLLELPFVDTVSLWPDIIKNVKEIQGQLLAKNKFVHMYVTDEKKLTALLSAKQQEVCALRSSLALENHNEVLDVLKKERLPLQSKLEELKKRFATVGIPERLRQEFIKKINELSEKVILIYNAEASVRMKIKQILIIKQIVSLHCIQDSVQLFQVPLPEVSSIGYLQQEDLHEVNKILHDELQYWLSYEDVITHEDIERSLLQVVNKLAMSPLNRNKVASHLAQDVITFERFNDVSSASFTQRYFERSCKFNKINEHVFDINILADIAKIQNILLQCFIDYKKIKKV